MTPGQQRGWDQGFPQFGLLTSDGPLDWDAIWPTRGRRIVEIGFGMGDSLVAMAAAAPDDPYAWWIGGIGVGQLMDLLYPPFTTLPTQ